MISHRFGVAGRPAADRLVVAVFGVAAGVARDRAVTPLMCWNTPWTPQKQPPARTTVSRVLVVALSSAGGGGLEHLFLRGDRQARRNQRAGAAEASHHDDRTDGALPTSPLSDAHGDPSSRSANSTENLGARWESCNHKLGKGPLSYTWL